MRRDTHAGSWPSVTGPAPSAHTRPAFLGDL
jgi:hypothetical protein